MKFFFDNTFPPRLTNVMKYLLEREPHTAEHLRDRFSPDTPDPEWLTTLAREKGWIIITGDRRIVTTPQVREAWRTAGLTTFFLRRWPSERFWDIAWRFIKCWPDIVKTAETARDGDAFEIPFGQSHKIKQLKRRK